jgi:hypothetical protein
VIKVWPIDYSSSYLVRGTEDVQEARDAALRYEMDRWREDREPLDESDARLRVDQIKALKPEIGWWRTNPCYCGDEHRFDMGTADGPGRGNFRGVYLA